MVIARETKVSTVTVKTNDLAPSRRGGSYGARSEHVLLRRDVAPGDALDALFTCVRRQKWTDALGAPLTRRTYIIREVEARADIISMIGYFINYVSSERDG